MRKIFLKILIASFVIAIVGNVLWFITDRVLYEQREALFRKYVNGKKVFAYHTYLGALNPALYFKDKNDFSIYKEYYESLRTGMEPPSSHFRTLRYFPYNRPLVIVDSQVHKEFVEAICFDDSVDYFYKKGYILKVLLHDAPPSDSLLEANRKFYDSLLSK